MRCVRCGARIGKKDEFCRKCGKSVDRTYKGEFQDSFLEDREEGGHALLITILILLLIAVSVFVILMIGVVRSRLKKTESGGTQTVLLAENASENASDQIEGQGDPAAEGQDAGNGGTSAGNENAASVENLVILGENDTELQALEEAGADLEAETDADGQAEKNVDMAAVTELLMNSQGVSRAAAFVYDLNSNTEYAGSGSDEAMYATATITVPILYASAYLLDAGEITLDDSIIYVNSIGGRGEANPEERDQQPFPLSYYLTTMLTYSDNNCMNNLMDYLGRDRINLICQNAGFTSVDLQRNIVATVTDGTENYVSPRDLAMMVKELYNGKFTIVNREFMQQYFLVDEYDGLNTILGNSPSLEGASLFLNQNGKTDTRYSEVAVVEKGDVRYVICIMINGDAGFSADQNIYSAVDAVWAG